MGSIDISDKTIEPLISLKVGNITLEVKRGFDEETLSKLLDVAISKC